MNAKTETAVLGGGCFWCLEAVFEQVQGVQAAVSGYAGGSVATPNYKLVCTGTTGHAEVVQVTFDPAVISYADLLEIFFAIHDPTTKDRQGEDVGTQYRSIILTMSEEQRRQAEAALAALNESGEWGQPAVTQIEPLTVFYPAEDYHQEYFAENGEQGYCRLVIAPKLEKFRAKFRERLK
ncbi:peptide-methionine (S)-S-oxide reductase MsrA [bacterium]|nr:peptide-methionine (S)-S-oxide reductase MsrA [bacterium]